MPEVIQRELTVILDLLDLSIRLFMSNHSDTTLLDTPPSVSSTSGASSQWDTSSLYTLTDSIRGDLFRLKGGRRLQNLNEDYQLPCDLGVKSELLCQQGHTKIWPNGAFFEPEPGTVDRVLARHPTEGRRRVLELGSGLTACWAIMMAERYPDTEVTAVDLIPSDLSYYPPNLELEIHDLLEGLPYPDEFFSLIHFRTLACVSNVVNAPFLAEVARCLRPGGILLLEEPDSHDVHLANPGEPNIYYDLVCARARLHFRSVYRTIEPADAKRPPAFRHGDAIGEAIRQTEGFDPSSVVEVPMSTAVGIREGETPEESIGYLVREALLHSWKLGAASENDPVPSAEFFGTGRGGPGAATSGGRRADVQE